MMPLIGSVEKNKSNSKVGPAPGPHMELVFHKNNDNPVATIYTIRALRDGEEDWGHKTWTNKANLIIENE